MYSDSELIDSMKEGDERALQVIVDRYWKPLYKMAAKTLDDLAACEDIVQEIFIKLWNNRADITITHSLKAYLFASVRYEIYRHIKQQFRRDLKMDTYENCYIEQFNPENKVVYGELMDAVEKLVEALPDRCREIYMFSRQENLSHKEIAAQLNITPKTVENQLTIALRRIRIGIKKFLLLF